MHVSAAIIDEAERLLLVREAYGYYDWDLPGGGVEVSEALHEGVIREVREECGITIAIIGVVGMFVSYLQPGAGTNVVFVGRWSGGHLQPGMGEIDRLGWFSERDLPDPILPSRRPVIDAALQQARGRFQVIGLDRA